MYANILLLSLGLLATCRGSAGESAVPFAIEGASVAGMKCTTKGPPEQTTDVLAYLDPFVLSLSVKEVSKPESKCYVAAWFGQLSKNQLNVEFAREEDRGTPYEIADSTRKTVPPQYPANPKAIAFYPEVSNNASGRANLSKGIGGTPVPLIAAAAGDVKLYSSMHQRFSFSLIGLAKKDFTDYGARYSIEQLTALPAGMYQMRLPYTVILVDSKNKVVGVRHGEKMMNLDLTAEHREATLESFKGSGSPKMTLE
jgi:hypothetical protein